MMNPYPESHVLGKPLKRGVVLLSVVCALLIVGSAQAQNQQAGNDTAEVTRAAKTIATTMNPNAWVLMMTMSMDPRIWANPISLCSACHDNEDVGRYQQVFGPFVAAMTNPAMLSNPDAYNNMMASVLDAKSAEMWQRAVTEKYGLEPGDTAPTMHSWWPMVPTAPWPQPRQ